MTGTEHHLNGTIASANSSNTTTTHNIISTDIQQGYDLPKNYSILINKLERLALGLDEAFNNLSVERKEVEIAVSNRNSVSVPPIGITPEEYLLNSSPIGAGRIPPPYVPQRVHHGTLSMGSAEVEYSRVVSDIWIGVVLTLLIVSVIFFICSCFLYHKFQQWKNSYRQNPNEPVEICRRYPVDFEAESLPSYTIVSGLPTYDDALEEFRKAGIILSPQIPVIRLFDNTGAEAKDNIFDHDGNIITPNSPSNNSSGDGDNISISSTCTCGGTIAVNPTAQAQHNYTRSISHNALMSHNAAGPAPQVIELNPEQLAQLSEKRLSLQIAFNTALQLQRGTRPRVDLYREANRNNLLRSRGLLGSVRGGSPGAANAPTSPDSLFPPIHRSSSTFSLSANLTDRPRDRRLERLQQHRGSLY